MFGRLLVVVLTAIAHARPTEEERVRLWLENVKQWPPTWHAANESTEYQAAQSAREAEIQAIPGANERWENWMQFTQGRMVKKFTPMGFKVVKTPKDIHDRLVAKVQDAIDHQWESLPEESDVGDAIYGENRPLFVEMDGMDWEAVDALKELHEEWGGMKLVPTSAYGVRLYRDGASLVMHHDKVHTHVISSIVHLVHKYANDSEPWPIQIEDHDGRLHEVNLQEGQMLFYESAKCLHGRMKAFRGDYYGSIFLHYRPVDRGLWSYDVEQVIATVPPHWKHGIVEEQGSRWAGQAITVDSVAAAGAPPRIVRGQVVHDRKSPHAYYDHDPVIDTDAHGATHGEL